MNTEIDLKERFLNNNIQLDWQCKDLEEIDLMYVLKNCLKEKFVVEIENSKYDVMFGINKRNKLEGVYSSYPGKQLSYEMFIEKAMKYGKWFRLKNNS